MLSSIGNSVTNAISTGAVFAGQVANKVYGFGGQICNYITPALSGLVAKVNSLNVPTYVTGAVNLAKSPVGMTTLALSAAVLCLVASRKVENRIAKGMLLIAGVTSIVFSAVAVTKPFGFMKA
jgi:hypothetical protein